MDGIGSDQDSEFITNFNFVPPSPPPLDASLFDYPAFNELAPINITSPPLPYTSSYNSSNYSPLSQQSELSFSVDDLQLQDFPSDYEPSDYEAPNQDSLLMFTNDSDYMSPHHKHQSSPRLLMPDEHQHNVPIINPPYGDDDMMDGPHLCIVPATPVSGGGVDRASVPFQATLASLSQGPEQEPLNDHQQSFEQKQSHRDPSPSRSSGSKSSSPNLSANSSFAFPNEYPQPQQQQQQQQSHPRAQSDQDPWNPNCISVSSGLEKMNVGNGGGAYDFQRQQWQAYSFRRSVSDTSRHHRYSRSEDVRSPPMPYSGNNSNGPGFHHHQQSRSIGGTTAASATFLLPPSVDFHTGQQQQNIQNLHPSHVPKYLNPSATPPGTYQQPHSLNLLSAAGSVSTPDLSSSNNAPGMGLFRRGSTNARSDRGAEVWGTQGHHGLAPRRMSPYPTPNASPRVRYDNLELDPDLALGQGGDTNAGLNGTGTMGLGLGLGDYGDPPVSAGFDEEVALSRRGSYSGLNVSGGSQKAESVESGVGDRQSGSNVANVSQYDVLPSHIPRANVTTGRTANASHRRRKQDANFICHIPGCGSTFTRGFNLKGHLRSHFEQKPYKCGWPGCGKGFARKHDCKRHEHLHSNFRPFECDGCKKPFARMDALNRHLRSETAVECARIAEKEKGVGGGMALGMGMGVGNATAEGGYGDMGMMLTFESEEQKYAIPKRRQSGGGGADSWSGVAL